MLESANPPVMPVFHFQCPHCTSVFQVNPALAGQHVACPNCQGVVAIGEFTPPESPEATKENSPPVFEAVAPVHHFDEPSQVFSQPDPGSFPSRATPVPSTSAHETISTATPLISAAAPPVSELLGCPRCSGTFQVTAEMAGQQMACPHCGGAVTIPGAPQQRGAESDAPPIVAPGEGNPLLAFRVQEGTKKIVVGDRIVEVRRLSPEEKSRRRLIKRIVLIGFCAVVLIAAMLYLNFVGLPR